MNFPIMEFVLWVLGLAFAISWLSKNLDQDTKTGKLIHKIIQSMIMPFSNRWD